MITPTVGRVVWYKDGRPDGPCAAIVARVWSDRCVNLMVIDPSGNTFGATSVPLVQQEDVNVPVGAYCEWMPYQKGQAAKTEALEKKLSGESIPDSKVSS